ncbi:MAG: radical SAM protein [Clostridiales bacterium]|nr:radical SAM protein [Clostridiales bacterium]
MKELNIYSISGLYYEYYDLDYSTIACNAGEKSILENVNGFFWKEVFSDDAINTILSCLQKETRRLKNNKFRAVANNPKRFVENVKDALYKTSFHDLNMKEFFSALETLNIYCELYSEYISYPHVLTLEDGFKVNEMDSRNMIEIAMNASRNPYYKFLNSGAFEELKNQNPDIIWMRGKIRLSSLALAIYAKQLNPDVHICVVGHSSEYYSLNKITDYLKCNDELFQIIDSIVLNDDKNTVNAVYKAIENGDSLDTVNNLLYYDRASKEIKQTAYKNSVLSTYDWVTRRPNDLKEDKTIAAYNVVNSRLWPNSICFWNKCTFCGINKKYVDMGESVFGNVSEKVDILSELYSNDARYFWFIDEAIVPSAIEEIAKLLVDKNIDIKWQIRSRIDYEWDDVDFDLLYKSGLREIRLGLESGSVRVRRAMKKFSRDIENSYIENLIKKFNDHKISVHFPIIIGFPTETESERNETYSFLREMRSKYPLMSFNVNLLGLDVSSALFKEHYKFGISELKFPCDPRRFIGNLVNFRMWDDSFDFKRLNNERESFMRQVLYPWMPTNTIMEVVIFYRLCETSRNTLIWKCSSSEDIEIEPNSSICISKDVSVLENEDNKVLAYSFKTHHEVMGDGSTATLLNTLISNAENCVCIQDLIEELIIKDSNDYDWENYWKEINLLIELGFIEVKK